MKNCITRRCKNEFSPNGDQTLLIITRKNNERVTTIFDTCYLEIIQKYQWQYQNAGYIRTTGTQGNLSLHRLVCTLRGDDIERKVVDHIDGNPLNNLSSNLRLCTIQDNCRNTRKRPIAQHGGIIGVRKDLRCANSWRAQIYTDRHSHIERTFRDQQEAIKQRLKWELEYFGEFAPQMELIQQQYPDLLPKQ